MNFATTSPPATHQARGNARPAKNRVHSHGRKIDVPRGGKMEGSVVREKIAKHGMRNSNVLAIAPTATATGAKTFTAEEKNACSIDAMLNGGTCEACQ